MVTCSQWPCLMGSSRCCNDHEWSITCMTRYADIHGPGNCFITKGLCHADYFGMPWWMLCMCVCVIRRVNGSICFTNSYKPCYTMRGWEKQVVICTVTLLVSENGRQCLIGCSAGFARNTTTCFVRAASWLGVLCVTVTVFSLQHIADMLLC